MIIFSYSSHSRHVRHVFLSLYISGKMNEKISQIVISRSTVDIRYITGNRCGGKVFQKARESVDLKVW
jgi:hypothetical protein